MKPTAIGMVGFFLTTIMYFSKTRDLRHETSVLRHSIEKSDSLLIETSERSLRYQLICYELNEITDKYQSSKREKLSRKKLIDLMSNAN